MPPHQRASLSVILHTIGAALGFSFLLSFWGQSVAGHLVVLLTGLVSAALWRGSKLRHADGAGQRCLGWLCSGCTVLCHLFWIYLAAAFGSVLYWTLPAWGCALTIVCALTFVVTILWRKAPFEVPAALPLGLFIALNLSGWLREENLVRCDDFLALRPPVQLLVPAAPELSGCRPGEVRRSGRFPRTIWESPDGGRLIYTTQGPASPDGRDGAVCAVDLPLKTGPSCVGRPEGKSQGMTEIAKRDRLLLMQWGLRSPDGGHGSLLFEVPTTGPLEAANEHWYPQPLAEGFYEPRNNTVYIFSDEMDGIYRASPPAYELQETLPIFWFTPGEVHYDPTIGEGVACGDHVGAAIRGAPFRLRRFTDQSPTWPELLSITWGCDWDPSTRKVYTTVPNLGLLTRLDYDSGFAEKRWWVGPGMRSVEWDTARRRVYFTNFLAGEVVAFDEKEQRIVDRWFVGRFSRWVRLTRDGKSLLATGNLGIVRIPLG